MEIFKRARSQKSLIFFRNGFEKKFSINDYEFIVYTSLN